MSTLKLGELVVPPGVVAGSGGNPWECLSGGGLPLPEDHPARAAAGRAARTGYVPSRISLTARTCLLNLGDATGDPGLLLVLTPDDAEPRAGKRGTWVVWGLSRPSVNLFLGPALKGISTAADGEPDPDKLLRIINSRLFSDMEIKTVVRVEDVFQRLTYRIYPDTPVSEVQHLMMRRRIPFVPVVGKEHEMLGVVTVREVLAHGLPGGPGPAERSRLAARDIMQRSVLCISEEDSLAEASRSIIDRDVAQLPVVREGELVGFVDRETVLRAFADTVVVPAPKTG